jgi:hypothetical protein
MGVGWVLRGKVLEKGTAGNRMWIWGIDNGTILGTDQIRSDQIRVGENDTAKIHHTTAARTLAILARIAVPIVIVIS